jgi:hypothetical protein
MLIKRLKELGFNFKKLPQEISDSIVLLDFYTNGTFESDNQKINVLDNSIFDVIFSVYKDDEIVKIVSNERNEQYSEIDNDGFNTIVD